MKLTFLNDTGSIVHIHDATFAHGCVSDDSPIAPLESRTFTLPSDTTPFVKLWDYGADGLQIFVCPQKEDES